MVEKRFVVVALASVVLPFRYVEPETVSAVEDAKGAVRSAAVGSVRDPFPEKVLVAVAPKYAGPYELKRVVDA